MSGNLGATLHNELDSAELRKRLIIAEQKLTKYEEQFREQDACLESAEQMLVLERYARLGCPVFLRRKLVCRD